MTKFEDWVAWTTPQPNRRLTLLCLPYAGGSALTYRPWVAAAPSWLQVVPIELPGRGIRQRLAARTDGERLVAQLAQDVSQARLGHLALFGHSMGAGLAFRLAAQLQNVHGITCRRLIVSGARPPGARRFDGTPLFELESGDFWREVGRFGGTPKEVLSEPALLQRAETFLKADFKIAHDLARLPFAPINTPILALGGRDDRGARPDDLHAWSSCTTSQCEVEGFEGGHFFLRDREADILRLVAQRLNKE